MAKAKGKRRAPKKAAEVATPVPDPIPNPSAIDVPDPARPMVPPSQRTEACLALAARAQNTAERWGIDPESAIGEEEARELAKDTMSVVAMGEQDGTFKTDLDLPGNRMIYLRTLVACGRHQDACAALGLQPEDGDAARRRSPEFQHKCDVALGMFASKIRRILVHRALYGHQEPMLGGRFRDEIVAYKTVHSDRLLELLARAVDKDLRDVDTKGVKASANVQVNVSGSSPLTLEQIRALTPDGRAALRTVIAELQRAKADPQQAAIDARATETVK